MKDQILLNVEELEERIAPSLPPGLDGYEGQPGNQGGHGGDGGHGNPSGSANPEVSAGNRPQPNP
jgi:hypothetical protein